MPMPAPAEASLINGDEFLDELEHSEHLNEYQPDPALDSPTYADAFDALESGLSIDALARSRLVCPITSERRLSTSTNRRTRTRSRLRRSAAFRSSRLL